jgi:hypothetical protein
METDTKILVGIIVIVSIIFGALIYGASQPKLAYIAPQLKDSKAAQEIAALGIPVVVEELGTDGQGYTVRGQTQYQITEDGQEHFVKVVLDDDVDPTSYEAQAILYHELGHIVLTGDADTEAGADEFAGTKGYEIVDAYHGIH